MKPMLNNLIHPALIDNNGTVSLSTDEVSGDNPITDGELSDLMRRVITSSNQLRIVISS